VEQLKKVIEGAVVGAGSLGSLGNLGRSLGEVLGVLAQN